jgi:hypothetical protein
MTDARARKYRQRKFGEQQRRCFYCGFPMWARKPETFAGHFDISLKDAARFKCTAEHLLALRDGGTSRQDNIVAACWFCNYHRHARAVAPPPDRFLQLVRGRVVRHGWHHQHLHKILATFSAT